MSIRPFPLIATIVPILLMQIYCVGQDKSKPGKITAEDFVAPSSLAIDSSVDAVILASSGSISFEGNYKGRLSFVFKRYMRILIRKPSALALASMAIGMDYDETGLLKMRNVTGSTYNLVNGQVVETKLDKKDIIDERPDKNTITRKWNMPAAQAGSIIEYSYSYTAPGVHLPSWDFQSMEYPTVWSELEVEIPQTYFYVTVRQGVHPFAVDTGSQGKQTYQAPDVREDPRLNGSQSGRVFMTAFTTRHRWVMKDLPAFHAERYLTSPLNYLDRISFQLDKTYDGQDLHDYINSWKLANEMLLKRYDFGEPIAEENEWLDDVMDKFVGGATDRLDLAKKIYYQISNQYTCTSHSGKYLDRELREVVKYKKGTVGDLNLLLIAMLRRMHFTADPVLLSTREHGFNMVKYPILDKLNYVIVRLEVAGKIYYLDAARPKLGFGQLAGNCYNGHARVISEKDSASVYFEADNLKETRSTLVFLVNGPKGLEGTYQSLLGPQQSYDVREVVNEHGKEAFFKEVQSGYVDVDVSNGAIDSLDKPEKPVNIRYDFAFRNTGDEKLIYFNPLFGEGYRENPFKAEERQYPVEMPYVRDEIYVLNMEVPAGYAIDELPKSSRVAFNGDQGMFEYLVEKQGSSIQLRCHLKLTHANFSPDDYSSLRDFFAYVVKKESEQIVLKKL